MQKKKILYGSTLSKAHHDIPSASFKCHHLRKVFPNHSTHSSVNLHHSPIFPSPAIITICQYLVSHLFTYTLSFCLPQGSSRRFNSWTTTFTDLKSAWYLKVFSKYSLIHSFNKCFLSTVTEQTDFWLPYGAYDSLRETGKHVNNQKITNCGKCHEENKEYMLKITGAGEETHSTV